MESTDSLFRLCCLLPLLLVIYCIFSLVGCSDNIIGRVLIFLHFHIPPSSSLEFKWKKKVEHSFRSARLECVVRAVIHPTGNLRWRHVRELAFKWLLCSDEEYFWHVQDEHFARCAHEKKMKTARERRKNVEIIVKIVKTMTDMTWMIIKGISIIPAHWEQAAYIRECSTNLHHCKICDLTMLTRDSHDTR